MSEGVIGCRYLHQSKPKIIHRDLNLDNIMLTKNPEGKLVAKIGDFGLHAVLLESREMVKPTQAECEEIRTALQNSTPRVKVPTPQAITPGMTSGTGLHLKHVISSLGRLGHSCIWLQRCFIINHTMRKQMYSPSPSFFMKYPLHNEWISLGVVNEQTNATMSSVLQWRAIRN